MQRSVLQPQHPAPRFLVAGGRAAHRLRPGRAGEGEMTRAIAKADGEDALALHDALEVALHPLPRAARIEVAHEPLEGQPIDQRHDGIRDRGERESERYYEA